MDADNETCLENDTIVGVQIVAGLSVFLGLCNVCLGLFVFTFIFLLKRHHFHSQRLVLYLSICVILCGIKSAIDVHAFVEPIPETSPYCTFCGLLHNYVYITLTLAVFVITVDTFLLVTFNVNTSKLDILEVLFIFALPILWLWIPLLPQFNVYGSEAVQCNLIKVNYTACEKISLGTTFSAVLFDFPTVVITVTMFVLCIITIFLLRRRLNMFEGRYDPNHRTVMTEKIKRAKYLLINPFLYMVFAMIGIIHRSLQYNLSGKYVIELAVITVLTWNGRSMLLLLSYTFQDRETCLEISCLKLSSACLVCFCRNDPVTDYTDAAYVDYGDSLDSAEEEKRRTARNLENYHQQQATINKINNNYENF